MATKGDKLVLFLSVPPFQDPYHCRFQVVVAQPVRDTLEMVKGQLVPFKERFLLLTREGADEQLPRIAQPHDKQVDGQLLATDDRFRFGPVHLSIYPRIELQRDVHRTLLPFPPPLADVAPHTRLTAGVSLFVELFVNLVPGVLLLARQSSAL